jgi:hypothetical protein
MEGEPEHAKRSLITACIIGNERRLNMKRRAAPSLDVDDDDHAQCIRYSSRTRLWEVLYTME